MSARLAERPRAPAPPRPPRVSRQRYLVRRVMVLVLLAALIALGFRIADWLEGDSDAAAPDESTAVESSAPEVSVAEVIAPTEPSAVAETQAPGTSAVVVTETAAVESTSGEPVIPSAATPAKVLIAGDSDAGTFGPYLTTLLDQTGIVATTLDYKVSTGLARPDYFDWPAYFRQQIATVHPDIVVVTFGGNDAQGLSRADGSFIVGQPTGTDPDKDAEWKAEYGRRLGEVMDFLAADRRTVVWVGIPNDDQDTFTARLGVLNEVVKEQVAAHPGVVFIDTWARFSGRDGNWAEYVIDPRDGQGKDVRASDGFHLNENGAEILALDIADAVREELRARGASI